MRRHRHSIIIITIQAPYRLHLTTHMPFRLHLHHHHSIIQITLILRSCKIHTTQQHTNNIIQHSRRASSRLADLTSMVRDSFRRVNVVSETDSEKASPAAARPAARPQLSWRASAPEYGTFES